MGSNTLNIQLLQPYSTVRRWDDEIEFLRNYRLLSHSLFSYEKILCQVHLPLYNRKAGCPLKLKSNNPWENMFYSLKICQLKVGFVVVDNGGQGRSMGANENGLVRVGFKQGLQGSDIPFLNHGEGLPSW